MKKVNCKYCDNEFEVDENEIDELNIFCSDDCRELFYGGGYDDRKDFDFWNDNNWIEDPEMGDQ